MDARESNNRSRYRHHQNESNRMSNGNGYMGEDQFPGMDHEEVEGDPEVWNEFTRSFTRVQSVLDRNRVLIQQVNDNHQSRMPENMARNVPLIRELNGNISKVVSMYSDLGTNFTSTVQERRQDTPAKKSNGRNGGRSRDD
ncbi:hypothetical protein V2J09_012565 [Rumex salicifolius]